MQPKSQCETAFLSPWCSMDDSMEVFEAGRQHLLDDLPRRMDYCTWLADHPHLCKKILFTNEAIFTRSGSYNTHNTHWWSNENPHKTVERHFQHQFSVIFWCGVLDDQLIGPHVFEGSLTGEVYANFLRTKLPLLLEDVQSRHIVFDLGVRRSQCHHRAAVRRNAFPYTPAFLPHLPPNAPDLLPPLSPIPPTPRSDPLSLTTLSPCSQPSTPPSLMPLCNE
ncbi:hypothetical protein Pcinc_015860 [Petrolisthes cinctipes]|uniref:Uncharacterized protein n=1 Tax=Petrolisthes cinctipes TaxID=88211 RepID=A0AAE1FXE8_PETCI|nr:hypothetical protein Pcinc_015860 [Petrolisthes cinctipes]